ncbi:DUF2490 domain-containing protein [Lutimonas sp.]|uniref:DUF2490 domain-containing protein n=1 Tax=Lutimonas sp. TaxID=1872403 RepID=UPI003D9B63B0
MKSKLYRQTQKRNHANQIGGIILALIFWGQVSWAQEDRRDFESWTSAELRYKPTKRWKTGMELQMRLKENSSEIDGYFAELTGGYEIFKNFDVGLGLRFIRKNDNTGAVQGYENHGRIHADASYKHKINRLALGYRLRYQNKDELGVSNENGDFADQYIRLKVGTEYDFKKWKLDPQLSAEIFHHSEKNEENEFNKFRITFGTDYKFKKAGKIGVYYRYEKEINTADPRSTDILRIRYIYTFKGY